MNKKNLCKSFGAVLILAGCSVFAACNTAKVVETAVIEEPLIRKTYDADKGVYYNIFVRAFADSDGDGIGDFNGITARLDYLNDGDDSTTTDLGVTGIWLMPIYPSHSYHGYDVDDYYAVNPEYGTMADFENLVKECNKRGIRVILDMTVNHSSTYNQWFQKSRNPENKEHDWYHWITPETKGFSITHKYWGHNLWNEDPIYRGNYYAGLFGDHMPDFNLANPEVREEFKKVMKFWMDKGVNGFRYDAAGHVFNAAKVAPGTNPAQSANEFFEELIAYNKSINPETYSVGEVWENSSVRATYAKGLGSDFHFEMGDRIISIVRSGMDGNNRYAFAIQMDLERLREEAPGSIDAPFLINHDTARQGHQVRSLEGLKACASLYLLMEGVPFMYYGEEIGMASSSADETKRTPMIWDYTDEETGKPKDKLQATWEEDKWNAKTIPVAQQLADENSLLNYYSRLIHLRLAHPALYEGKMLCEDVANRNLSSWKMESDSEDAFVIVNVTNEDQPVTLGAEYAGYVVSFGSSEAVTTAFSKKAVKVVIPPKETLVLTKAK